MSAKKMKTKMTKKAELGGGQDVPFEQAFANLAHAYLKDKAPSLMDYEVGFQLVDRNQENTKAVGVFGFQVGSQWIYAPVFFLNGDLKGHELLYLKSQDMFVPLKEDWLNYILNRRPHVLGESVDKNLSNIGVMPPHLQQIARSPHKFASAVTKWPLWAQEALPSVAQWITENPFESKRFANVPDLPSIVKESGDHVTYSLLRGMDEFPKLAGLIESFYGLEFIDQKVKDIRKKAVEKQASSILDTPTIKTAKKKSKEDKGNNLNVHVFKEKDLENGSSGIELDDEDRKTLVRERVLIKDKREDGDVSIAYNVQTKLELTTPDDTGLYDILVKPGGFEKCFVIKGPYHKKGRKTFVTVVNVEDGPKTYLNIHPSYIWARQKLEDKAYKEWWNKLSDATELSKGSMYVIITPTGEGTCPFEVESVLSNENGIKMYDVYFHSYGRTTRPAFLPELDESHFVDYDLNNDYGYFSDSKICLTGKQGADIQARGGTLYIPDGCKLLKLKDSDTEERPEPIQPGSMIDAQMMLFGKLARIELRSNGITYDVADRYKLGFNDALTALVVNKGFREKQARTMLKEAKAKGRAEFLVKYAGPYLTEGGGPSAPNIPDAHQGYDPMTGDNIPTQYMTEHNLAVPDLSSANTDRSIYAAMGPDSPWSQTGKGGPDQSSMQSASQAAQTGQKEVFDTAMLGSLLKSTRDDAMVDRYMGDLMKGLDRLGRILFVFYWHQDAFEDRYGKNDLPELEDSLRNAFESVGDIVLFLKQKTVDPNPEEIGGRVDLGAVADA